MEKFEETVVGRELEMIKIKRHLKDAEREIERLKGSARSRVQLGNNISHLRSKKPNNSENSEWYGLVLNKKDEGTRQMKLRCPSALVAYQSYTVNLGLTVTIPLMCGCL